MRDYYTGFELARLGEFSITGTSAVTLSSGTYAHIDLQGVMGSGKYDDFATALKAAMDTAGGGPWTVTYSQANLTYTISRATNFTLTFPNTTAGNNAADALGFTRNTSYTGTNTRTSVRRPFYVVRSIIDGQSAQSDEYEPDDITSEAVANDGASYMIARQTSPILLEWVQPKETNTYLGGTAAIADQWTPVFERNVTTLVPWSWQDLFQHARGIEPLALNGGSTTTTVVKLRQDGASFRPLRVTADLQLLWDIPIRARLLGRIA